MFDINYDAYISSEQKNMSEFQDGLERIGLDDYFKVCSNNICFSLDGTIYTFYISENSIFYNGNNRITYSVGDLFINAVNVMREDMQFRRLEDRRIRTIYVLPKFNLLNNKFKKYGQQYKKPTVELLKAYYQDLLSVGFCDINAALIVWEFLNFFISDNDKLEKELRGKNYNLLYSSLYHSLNAPFMNFNFFPCEDNPDLTDLTIDRLAPAVIETQISIKNGTLLSLYSNIDIENMLTFDKFQLIGNGYTVRTCEVCSRHFVNAENKKYHTKVCPNCRTLSQRKRKSNDEFFLERDRAYKAIRKRLYDYPKEHEFRKIYKEKYINPFMEEIKKKQPYYEEKKDLPGFKRFIKRTRNKYKIKKS